MASTNFGNLSSEQYTVWSRDFWKETRNKTFVMGFSGSDDNSMIQRITELSDGMDGARAVITMVNDSTGDGVVGDNQLKGNEEALRTTDCVITIDQWRHAHKSGGRMGEQKSIVKFRGAAKDNLSNTAARVVDEIAFQCMSGISLDYRPNLSLRVGSQLPLLAYAPQITAPSSRRHVRWVNSTKTLAAGDTTQVVAADKPSWEMLVDLKARAINEFIRPMRHEDGIESYNVFMCPTGIAALKKDPAFLDAQKNAAARGEGNMIFKGTKHGGMKGIYIDGLNILEYRNVINTQGTTTKWGAGTNVEGQRVLLCGAQALAFADIGNAYWDEEKDDFGNAAAIAIGKIFGFLKPNLFNTNSQSQQDYGVLVCDTAI